MSERVSECVSECECVCVFVFNYKYDVELGKVKLEQSAVHCKRSHPNVPCAG